jgi:hypothetical protein
MTGTSPLLMHNAHLSNPSNPFNQAIAEITSKKDKTAQDQREIARLEFCGGLYIGVNGPIIPAANVRKTFNNAAKVRREGRDIERALLPTSLEIPLQYKGPRTPEALWADETFHCLLPVRVGRARIMRMRPRFHQWLIESEWELIEEMMNFKNLVRIGNEAGLIEGICDGRNQGYGRFECEIVQVQTQGVRAVA